MSDIPLGDFLSTSLPGAGPATNHVATKQGEFGSKVMATSCYFIPIQRQVELEELNPLLCRYWEVKTGRWSKPHDWGHLWMPGKGESDGFDAIRILRIDDGPDGKQGIEVETLTVWN